MGREISITVTKDMESFLLEKVENTQSTIESMIENIIKEQVNSKVYFEDGFYFDKQRNRLFTPDKKEIEFTKLQSGLFNLLLERKNKIIDFDTISDVVWKNRNMSIFTMRNIVKRIRDLTYYGIIINHSNKGYQLGKTI